MELVLYAGNDFIASLPVDPTKLTLPGYVGSRKRELLRRCAGTLLPAGNEPEFFLVPLNKAPPPVISPSTPVK